MALDWFASYLSNRKHVVKINGCISEPKTINIGLPQGSLLSPVLFLLYINDLPRISSTFFPVLYADDTTMCFSGPSLPELIQTCNSDLNKFSNWANANKLSINIDKTNFSFVTNRPYPNFPIVYLNQRALTHKSEVKFLGVILDEKLKFDKHVKYVRNKISKSIGIINNLKEYVPLSVLKSLYYSFIYPYLIYCVTAWGGTYSTHIEPLRIIQKRAIRTINKKPYLYHTEPLFSSTKILKIDDVFILMVCIYIYKNNLISYFNRTHNHNTRHYSQLQPFFQRLTTTQKSIYYIGPTLLNTLPEDIKRAPSLESFKNALKRYLISNYSN